MLFLSGCTQNSISESTETSSLQKPVATATIPPSPSFPNEIDYTSLMDLNIPTIIERLGDNYDLKVDMFSSYWLTYELENGSYVEFNLSTLPDETEYSLLSLPQNTGVYTQEIQFYGAVDITGNGLIADMALVEIAAWCAENNYEVELEETYLQANINGMYLFCKQSDGEEPSAILYSAAISDSLFMETDTYDDIDPYENMSEFEYIAMIHQSELPQNDDVLRDIDSYIGTPIGIAGQVVWTSGIEDAPMQLLVRVSVMDTLATWLGDAFSEDYYVSCFSYEHLPILKGDMVVIYGEIGGADSYKVDEQVFPCYYINIRYYELSGTDGVLGGGHLRTSLSQEEKNYWFEHTYQLYGDDATDSSLQNAYELYLTEDAMNGYPYCVTEIIEYPLRGYIQLTITHDTLTMVPSNRSYTYTSRRKITLYYDGRLDISDSRYSTGKDDLYYSTYDLYYDIIEYNGNVPEDRWNYHYKRADLI